MRLHLVVLQVGVFGKVDKFQKELDRIASLLDSDDEEAMGELVHGKQGWSLTIHRMRLLIDDMQAPRSFGEH